ncbi:hypothetical protein [Bradyrhizobium sp. CCBAU 53338]|uniref:hypothetical protein n=1 Tax=Bradyrhizobium sp. CCBAU 53338 TaxID=1325111 RepID=UPI00188B1EBB|nr:hypothetical protein [Bradyrhizobium sp. CCBAU 53338]
MKTLAMRVLELTRRLLERMSQIKRNREPALSVWLKSYGGELTPPREPVPIRRRWI